MVDHKGLHQPCMYVQADQDPHCLGLLDKSAQSQIIFLISQPKHILLRVLKEPSQWDVFFSTQYNVTMVEGSNPGHTIPKV